MVIVLLGILLVLLGTMALVDFRARRRGHRHTGVDGKRAGDQRRLNESDLRLRSNQQDYGQPPATGF